MTRISNSLPDAVPETLVKAALATRCGNNTLKLLSRISYNPCMRSPVLLSVASAAALSVVALAAQAPDADLVRRARAIHDRVIALDTHNDIEPENFTPARNYTQRLDTQVNLPKMVEGGLDASFFIVY